MGQGKGYSGPLLELCHSIVRDYEARRDAKASDAPRPQPKTKWPDGVFDWGPKGGKSSSENHETMAWCGGAALAALMRDSEPTRWQQRRQVLIDAYYKREFEVGLWGREQCVPDNHSHQHLPGTLARLAAVESRDSELLRLSAKWMDALSIVLAAFSTPDGQFWPVGLRAPEPNPPTSFHATAYNRLLHGWDPPLPQFTGKNGQRNWDDSSVAGLRALRFLQSINDDATTKWKFNRAGLNLFSADWTLPAFDAIAKNAPQVTLKFPVVVYRGRDRFLAVLIPGGPSNKAGLPATEVCDWVEVPYLDNPSLKRTGAQVRCGYNWSTKPPAPPKDAMVVRFNEGK